MAKPNMEDVSRFHRYFAIESNNEFWSLSEGDLSNEDKQRLLTASFTSLFHWSEIGTEENKHLAYLAVARALCVNGSSLSVQYAEKAFEYFDGQGADWVQAFTNAVFSHACHIVGEDAKAHDFYERAVGFQVNLSEGDRSVFDATFKTIPEPQHAF